jgi:hypothetical protein
MASDSIPNTGSPAMDFNTLLVCFISSSNADKDVKEGLRLLFLGSEAEPRSDDWSFAARQRSPDAAISASAAYSQCEIVEEPGPNVLASRRSTAAECFARAARRSCCVASSFMPLRAYKTARST